MDGFIGGLPPAPRLSWAVRAREAMMVGSLAALDSPSRVRVARSEETCPPGQANLCEKPASGTPMTVPITLGVCIPLVAALGVLFFLHRRNVKKVRQEDAMDPHKSLDFGLGENVGATGKSKRKSFLGREKDSRLQRQQMSMDMNLSSPYLLPPGLQDSRESLNSLARTIHSGEDPYRPVAQYAASDAGSIRSMARPGAESIYSRSASRQQGDRTSRGPNLASRQNSRDPTSPGFPPSRENSFPLPSSPLSPPRPSRVKPEGPFTEEPESIAAPDIKDEKTPYPENDSIPVGAAIQEPPPVAQKSSRRPTGSPIQPSPADSAVDIRYELGHEKNQSNESSILPPQAMAGLGLVNQAEPVQVSARSSVSSGENAPVTMSGQQRGPHTSMSAPIIEEPIDYYRFDFADEPEAAPKSKALDPVEEERGRNMQRLSHLYDQQNRQSGLGIPQGDNRRLSVGFRPLPPAEITESEDPEYRANRIRSFYKEYFEDGKPVNAPPVPQLPAEHQQHNKQRAQNQQSNGQQQQGGGSYYEDYSENYAPGGQDGAYFDPVTNSFVMPYAQPVSRRAMTPPPLGQRVPGPRPPRQFHGSMGGMRMPGPPGSHGGSRPGSAASSRMGPRPGSSASAAYYNRSRAGSAMSGSRYGGPPKKNLPPPAALSTLPTPSKLKDDSFAIFNAADFAPPETFADRQRGRSQSPMGERRPYKPTVPAHTPLVNAFDELSSLPSPHMLRKSSTFTALDFAPPRKFADANDNRSETGSIRSNKSGISAVQLGAIRNGAGRVSRLPGDTIFTQAALQEKLKPQWGLRD